MVKYTSILLLILFIAVSCNYLLTAQSSAAKSANKHTTYPEVLSVFLHNENHISFLAKSIVNRKLQLQNIDVKHAEIRFISDVASGNVMWVQTSTGHRTDNSHSRIITVVHVRTLDDVIRGDYSKFWSNPPVAVEP
jgi:hypothetical protein